MKQDEVLTELTDYARSIVNGKKLAGQYVQYACRRFLDDLRRAKKEDFPYEFDEKKAWRVIYFIEMLPHVKGKWAREGKRLSLEPWQKFIVGQVFGWAHKETGLRRFRTIFIEVPRKNAKSTIAAAVGIFMLCMDGEAGAECYSAATKRDQARIVFDDARSMVIKTPPLAKRYDLDAKAHTIIQPSTNSKFSPLAADSSGLDGLNIHFCAIDELHAHRTRSLYDVLETATGAREQSLIWNVTTAGVDRNGICYELRTYLTKVLEGLIKDETFFGVIYAMDPEDDWLDPKVWEKANPNWGISVSEDDIARKAKKAENTPSAQANFLTKHLNRWVNAYSPWMDMVAWDLCKDDIKIQDFRDCPCWIGVDLANRVDPAAVVLVFQQEEKLYTFQRFYMPEDTIQEKAHTVYSHYINWAREEVLTVIPGPVIDQDVLETDIIQYNEGFDVREVAFDPWQAQQLMRNCHRAGVNVVEVRPGVKAFSEPMKHLEGLVKQQRVVHDGNPMMTWMASNVVAHLNAKDEIYPRKDYADSKIDGIIGLLMCLNRILADEGPLPIPSITIF